MTMMVLVGLVVLGMVALAGAGLVVGLVLWSRSRGQAGGAVAPLRTEVLESLGYEPFGSQWRMRMARSDLLFEPVGDGWRWSVTLPRYNTLTLRVDERANRNRPAPWGEIFETRNPEIDERFEVSSPLPAQTLALLMDPKVTTAMLGMPFLSMSLKGDELVIDDPALQGVAAAARRATGRSAEVEVHRSVVALVMSIHGALYSRGSGTLLPQHR